LTISLYKVNLFGFIVAMIFFLLLTIGFILEYQSGAISMTNNKK
jgi:NADH-ubiquinone oxidoreductase chain 3